MYQSGETVCEKTSNEWKVTETEWQKYLPHLQKNGYLHESPHLRQSKAIDAICVAFPDRLIYQTGETVGEKTSNERKVMTTTRTHALTWSTKNRLTERVATSTPIPKHCRNFDRMPHRLMYQTGETVGEKTSNERKVSAAE